MNKHITHLLIAAALVVPSLACASEQKQDNITLKVNDYAQETTSVLGYTPDGALTAEKFLAKGIHPVRITIKNDTNKPVMISGRSMRLKCIDQQGLVDIFQTANLWTSSVALDSVALWFGLMAFDHVILSSYWTITNTVIAINRYYAWSNKNEIINKMLKDLTTQEELRYPEVIQPGKKISKLLLIDERISKKRMVDFLVFDEKHEEVITKFEIKLS